MKGGCQGNTLLGSRLFGFLAASLLTVAGTILLRTYRVRLPAALTGSLQIEPSR